MSVPHLVVQVAAAANLNIILVEDGKLEFFRVLGSVIAFLSSNIDDRQVANAVQE